jgi:hypothetical protein
VQLLQEAVREFEGTSEEVSIMVADCEASISLGDVAGAVQRLKQVPNASPHYARACVAMAEIHLKHRKDKAAFIKCYLHLVVSDAVGGRGVLPVVQLVPSSLATCLGCVFDRLPQQCVLV